MSIYDERVPLSPKLHSFDLRHNHFLTMDNGYLYPIDWQECVAGDVFECNLQALIRCLPLVSPILNNLTCMIDAFFVPSRLLWSDFEKFFTTVDDSKIPPETFTKLPPVWGQHDDGTFDAVKLDLGKDTIWNHIGLNVALGDILDTDKTKTKGNLETYKEFLPTDFLRRAYYSIFNNWYRDQNFQEAIDYTNSSTQKLLRRAWTKDYFTASLYSRQKGTAPSIPLTGVGNSLFSDEKFSEIAVGVGGTMLGLQKTFTYDVLAPGTSPGSNIIKVTGLKDRDGTETGDYNLSAKVVSDNNTVSDFMQYLTDHNTIDFSNVATFDVSDIRDMFAIQRQFEGLMNYGSRYIEVLQGIYGTSPSDYRLQIPERLGSLSFNIQINEVIQTSASVDTSPQGNQSGHALGVSDGFLFRYKCDEPGWILILASIQPPAVYKNRFPRELFRKSYLEQYSPYFVNLSFQAIKNREIFGQLKEVDNGIWAYQGRYDEMRTRESYVSGQLLNNLSSYLMMRNFSSLPAMNSDFISCNPDDDVYSVVDEDKYICNFYIDMTALRPLPPVSIPGMLDHVYGGN